MSSSTLGRSPEHGTINVAPWAIKASKAQTTRTRNGNELRDACGKGHKYVEGSYRMQKDSNGRLSRRCKICARERGRENDAKRKLHQTPEERAKIVEYSRMRRAAKRLGMPIGEYREKFAVAIKKNPLDSFKLNPEQSEKQEKLNHVVDLGSRPKCETDPDSYFGELDDKITDEQALSLCEGCPLMGSGVCLDYAKTYASKDQIMVAEGRVFIGTELRIRGE